MKYSYFFGICLVLSDAFPQTEIKVTFHSRPNSPVVTFQKSFNNPSRILIGAGFELSWPFAKNITTILKHFKPTERRFKKKIIIIITITTMMIAMIMIMIVIMIIRMD